MRNEPLSPVLVVFSVVLVVATICGAAVEAAQRVDPVGAWRYQKGGFGDDITLTADGRAISGLDPGNAGRWQMEGDVLVIRWQNGWTNRYQIGSGPGPYGGTDIDPQGAAQAGGSFSRRGAPAAPAGVDVSRQNLGDGLTEYLVSNHDHGTHELPMPGHRYCALSYVHSGGFNSGCQVRKNGKDWVLVTVDPAPPDGDFIGQTQGCGAICFD